MFVLRRNGEAVAEANQFHRAVELAEDSEPVKFSEEEKKVLEQLGHVLLNNGERWTMNKYRRPRYSKEKL